MYSYFDFKQLGGFPLNQQRLEFLQQAYSASIGALNMLVGDNVIVTGCIVNGNSVTDGWVIIGGELLPFIGGTNALQSTILVRTSTTSLTFWDNSSKPVQFSKFCTFGIGAGAIEWSSLTRLKTIKELTTTTQELNNETQKLTDRMITGTFKDVLIENRDSWYLFHLFRKIDGVVPKEWMGFLPNPYAAQGVLWEYMNYSPDTLDFCLRIPADVWTVDPIDIDYVLIKK